MKTNLLILVIAVIFLSTTVIGQNVNNLEPVVQKAVYFDKTPPLRDMKIIIAGERDRSWKDNIIGNMDRDESLLYSNKKTVAVDHALQQEMGTRSVDGPIYNFAGIGYTGYAPPDTDGDVGPDHYFQMINVSFAIWDKQGTLLYGPVDNSTLWDGFVGPWTGTNDGDPIVLYDDYADRWVATQFAINTGNGTNWQLIAVSETSDPLGAYYRYAYQFTQMNDYPKFSIWPDGYYSTYNIFGSSGYAGNITAVMDRDAMLIGDADAQMIKFGPYPLQYGTKTAHLDGPTPPPTDSPNWVVNLNKYGSQALEVYKFETDWVNPSNSSYSLFNTLSVTAFDFFDPNVRPQLPQPNSTQLLDPLSKYLMNPLYYRNFGTYEAMVVNHTVKLGSRAGVRWYELRRDLGPNDWYIYQHGTYAPNDGLSRWMASIAINANGDIALGYSVTGDTTYPSVRYTGRTASSPPGVMDIDEITLVEGNGSQNGTARWGDYSALSVDPSDDLTFWYTGEYMPSSSWGTRISSFDLGPISPPTAFAGDDGEICSQQAYYGQGSATGQQSVLWTTLGDGNFINQNTLTPGYIRGSGDLALGSFELVLTAYGYEPGMEAADTVYVDIIDDVMVDLGNDTLICFDETLLLNPDVTNVDSLMWTTSGDGIFSNDTILNPMYTPGTQDIANGEVTLNLYAEAFAPCDGDDEDDLHVTIDACTGLDDLENDRIGLYIYPNPSTGVFNLEVNGNMDESFDLNVVNLQGKSVFNGKLNLASGLYKNSLDLSYLPRGVYYVTIRTELSSTTKKIIFE